MANKQFSWDDKTWNVLDSYFTDKSILIRHHLESYNYFISPRPWICLIRRTSI